VTVGDPLQSSQKAQGGISGTTLTEPVRRAYGLVPPALQLAALAAAAIAALRLRRTGLRAVLRAAARRGAGAVDLHGERELTVLALFLGALAWVVLVAVTSKVANYAGISRFQHPAAAVISVLAGVGAVWAAQAAAGGLARRRRGVPAVLVATVLIGATLPTLPSRARRIDEVVKDARARSDLDRTLGDAIDAAGGRERVLACGFTYTGPGNESALAWHLDRHIDEVSSDAARPPGAVVRVDSKALRSEKVRRLGIRLYPVRDRIFDPVADAGVWEVLAACRPGAALGRGPA
jgi:hypothetical protein